MARTARYSIVPFWYNMQGSAEENREAERLLGLKEGELEDPEEDPAPFEVQLKPLNGAELMKLSDHLVVSKLTDKVDYTSEGRALAVRMGLVGWRNINNDSGVPIPFTAETALEILTPGELKLIVVQILNRSNFSEDLRKK